VDSGDGSGGRERRDGRTPPEEQSMRIGRQRSSRGATPPGGEGGISNDLIGGSSSPDPGFGQGSAPAYGTTPAQGPGQGAPFESGPSRYAPNPGASMQIGGQSVASDADLAPRFRPWAEPGAAAQGGPMRCHFLRSVGADGRLAEAQRTAVPTHRCAAFGDPLPLSLRQQELVCLQRVHVSCPRYVRGTLLANETQAAPAEDTPKRQVPILTILGVGMVVIAVYVLLGAALGLPPFGGGAAPTTIAKASPSKSPSASVTLVATASPTPNPTPSPVISASTQASATPTATPTPTPTPTPSPTPAPTPASSPTPLASATWPPGATASRMDLVVPCPDQSNCYIYTVRGAGPPPAGNGSSVADTVPAIAKFFGVSSSKVIEMNSWAASGIKAGDKLKIPPPTR